jgi:hypothetical protein
MVTMSSRRERRSRSTPKTSKADQDREVARKSFVWTRRAALWTGAGIVIAVVGIVVPILTTSDQNTANTQPKGMEVITVPLDRIGGAPILPVPIVTTAPVAYLPAGWQLYIDCLQKVEGKYLLAQISSGQYQDEWIDIFDIKTPEGQEIQKLKQPPPECSAS